MHSKKLSSLYTADKKNTQEIKKRQGQLGPPTLIAIDTIEREQDDENTRTFRVKKLKEFEEEKRKEELRKKYELKFKEEKPTAQENDAKKLDKNRFRECIYYKGNVLESRKDAIINNNSPSAFKLSNEIIQSSKYKLNDRISATRLPPITFIEKNEIQTAYTIDEYNKSIAMYDSIHLQPGVQYKEKGRDKKPSKSYNEAIGKMTKTEYGQKNQQRI